VVADAEHLHAGLVRGCQHLRAQRRLPDLHSCMWKVKIIDRHGLLAANVCVTRAGALTSSW
jgi:hypothetical protein